MSDSSSIATTELSSVTTTGAVSPAPVRNAGGDPTIFSGTLFAREDPLRTDGRVFASLHICELINNQIIETSSLCFDGYQASDRPELFGLCGIAMGNLIDDTSSDGVEAELVLTTLNGDLVVYELETAGSATTEMHSADGISRRSNPGRVRPPHASERPSFDRLPGLPCGRRGLDGDN